MDLGRIHGAPGRRTPSLRNHRRRTDRASAPNTRHQEVSGNLSRIVSPFMHLNPGRGKVFPAPTDVVLPRSAPGGRTGSYGCLERTPFPHRREEHRRGSGTSDGDPLRRDGKTGPPGEVLPLRTLRCFRVLDRRPGVANRPGLPALRHKRLLSSRFPSPRFFSVLGDSFDQKVRTLSASGRAEPAMAGPVNPDRDSHPQDAPMPGAPILPRPEGRGLPRDWINAGQIDETTGTDPEKKTFMPVPLCSPDPGGQSLFLQVVFLLGRQAGKRKSQRSLKVLWTFRTGRSEADVVFMKESFSSVTP